MDVTRAPFIGGLSSVAVPFNKGSRGAFIARLVAPADAADWFAFGAETAGRCFAPWRRMSTLGVAGRKPGVVRAVPATADGADEPVLRRGFPRRFWATGTMSAGGSSSSPLDNSTTAPMLVGETRPSSFSGGLSAISASTSSYHKGPADAGEIGGAGAVLTNSAGLN